MSLKNEHALVCDTRARRNTKKEAKRAKEFEYEDEQEEENADQRLH